MEGFRLRHPGLGSRITQPDRFSIEMVEQVTSCAQTRMTPGRSRVSLAPRAKEMDGGGGPEDRAYSVARQTDPVPGEFTVRLRLVSDRAGHNAAASYTK